ncbi:MAG: fibronectin type III domain-containing protein [Chitinophagaceae bacterium]|nr:fibronectin type III domain-containing protein [Chitinophagaceae bacterium]
MKQKTGITISKALCALVLLFAGTLTGFSQNSNFVYTANNFVQLHPGSSGVPDTVRFDVWVNCPNPIVGTLQLFNWQFGLNVTNAAAVFPVGATKTFIFKQGSNALYGAGVLGTLSNPPVAGYNATSNAMRATAGTGTSQTNAPYLTQNTPVFCGQYYLISNLGFNTNVPLNLAWNTGASSGTNTSCRVNFYVNNATSGSNEGSFVAAHWALGPFVTLNPPQGPTSAVLGNGSGPASGCNPFCGNIAVTIAGGNPPYTVVYTNGTSNFTVTNYTSGADINVCPSATTTYSLVSVSDGQGSSPSNSGTATLTVNYGTSSTQSVTNCGPYFWPLTSIIYPVSGTYQYIGTNGVGCPDTVTLNLTVNQGTNTDTTVTACNQFTWYHNGVTYTNSGTFTHIHPQGLPGGNGCPDTVVLNLTIIPSTTNTTVASACDTYTWSYNGGVYTASGSYSVVTGCHTEILNLTITPSTTNTSVVSACDTYTWSANGQVYTASGIYSYVSPNTPCHTEILDLTIVPSTSNTTVASACDTYTWSYNGGVYTATGIYSVVTGCHTEILDLTITPSTTNTTVASACDTYTWSYNGGVYTASGTYSVVTGCHTEILNLTITPSSSNTTVASACDTYTWTANGQVYTATGIYSYVSPNTPCHTEILDLTITPSTSNTTVASACDTYTWSYNGGVYTATGIYSVVTGCHTEILDLTITPSTTNTTVVSACDTYTWSMNGQVYTASGIYSYVSPNTPCHTEILDLTIVPSTSNTTVASACDTYTWAYNGGVYTATGIYSVVTGCHTEILDLTITPSTSNTTVASACDTYTWSYNGGVYTASGIYSVVTGCHTEILDLTITPSTSNTTVASACDTYTWGANGQVYTATGIYFYVSPNTPCQLDILDLTITPSTSNTSSASACGSYTWNVNGQTYTSSGSYSFVSGCHTEILNLTITPVTTTTTTASGCGSYVWSVSGQTYTSSGTYTFATGPCATAVLNLTINAAPVVTGIVISNVTGNSATVCWNAIAGIGWYEVHWRPVGSLTWSSGTNASAFTCKTLLQLTPGVQYEVEVRAFCNLQSPAGPWSSPLNFTTLSNSCLAPTGVIANPVTSTTATINWNPDPGTLWYVVYYRVASPVGPWLGGTTSSSTSKTITGLTPGVTYDVEVEGYCSGGFTPPSVITTFTTLNGCGTPVNLNATNVTNTKATLNWDAVTGAGWYNIRYRPVGAPTWPSTTTSGSNVKNIIGLAPSTQYEFQVATVCNPGATASAWSSSSLFTTAAAKSEGTNGLFNTNDQSVSLYPNPTQDVLNVDLFTENTSNTTVKVLDMSGRVVKQVQAQTELGMNHIQVSLNELVNGLYTVQVIENNKLTYTAKVTKN